MLFMYCAFSILIVHCHGIAEEYYDDRNIEDVPVIFNNTPDSRRTGETLLNSSLEQNFTTKIISKNPDYNYADDDELKIFVIGRSHEKYIKQKLSYDPTIKPNSSVKKSTSKKNLKYVLESNITTRSSALHFFSDYEYSYDDDDNTKQEVQVPPEANGDTIITKLKVHTDQNKTKVYHTDFYNLEPAAVIPKLNKTVFPDNKMWYVAEKYPCWELPVLYGKLGMRKNISEVFLVNNGHLKNVTVLEKRYNKFINRAYDIPEASALNKWCSEEPCYGDNTLCLFSDNYSSKICDDKYEVQKPTILEHIAIVNTVNAMRNSIANGAAEEYPQLPPAKNMQQIIYDNDLEKMATVWLHQCLPGPPPCSALGGQYVTQLECTKYANDCCVNSYKMDPTSKCIPKEECFVPAINGCIYAWFLSAGKKITKKDIECGHIEASTYNTVQLVWADSTKMGCAYGERSNGDIRVVCNFSPGAPYFLITQYYCGFISHKDITDFVVSEDPDTDLTNLTLLSSLGLNLHHVHHPDSNKNANKHSDVFNPTLPKHNRKYWSLDSLRNLYTEAHWRQFMKDYSIGTKGRIARLVTKYTFYVESESRCDMNEPVYSVGNPGSLCVEKSRRFHALCYNFRDPTPGYRLVAVVAPVALFSLILYDLFSGVVRQTNN